MSAHNLSVAQVPSQADRLRAWALGPQLVRFSDKFQPQVLDASLTAIETVESELVDCKQALMKLRLYGETFNPLSGPDDETQAEEFRLLLKLEKLVSMLDKLTGIHAKLTSVSAAALLASMTRPNFVRPDAEDKPAIRNVNPQRRLVDMDLAG